MFGRHSRAALLHKHTYENVYNAHNNKDVAKHNFHNR